MIQEKSSYGGVSTLLLQGGGVLQVKYILSFTFVYSAVPSVFQTLSLSEVFRKWASLLRSTLLELFSQSSFIFEGG